MEAKKRGYEAPGIAGTFYRITDGYRSSVPFNCYRGRIVVNAAFLVLGLDPPKESDATQR